MQKENINGIDYYHTWNNGTIEPHSWLTNDTSQVSNGVPFDASRFNWVYFTYNIARLNNLTLTKVTTDDLNTFNKYAYTDSATYWRTEVNKTYSFGSRDIAISFKHSQGEYDDYINYEIAANASRIINFGQPTYLALGLTNININNDNDQDTLVWFNDSSSGYINLTDEENYIIDNITALKIEDYPDNKAWDFTALEQPNKLLINGKNAYILYPIGESFIGGLQKTWIGIDASCSLTCAPGCSLLHDFWIDPVNPLNSSGQIPTNFTFHYKAWYSCTGGGSCSWGSCAVTFAYQNVINPNIGQYTTVSATQGGNGRYVSCADPSWGDNNCTGGAMTIANPTNQYEYTWKMTVNGKYKDYDDMDLQNEWVRATWAADTPHPDWDYPGFSAGGQPMDHTAPNVSFTTITNNTILNVLANSTDAIDANTWTNLTVGARFDDTGFFNGSKRWYWKNTSGSLFPGISFGNGQDNYTNVTEFSMAVQHGKYYKVCLGANSTYNGNAFSNWTKSTTTGWCYIFGVNIVPIPAGGTPTPQAIRAHTWLKEDDEDDLIKASINQWWIMLPTIVILIVLSLFYIKDRQTTS